MWNKYSILETVKANGKKYQSVDRSILQENHSSGVVNY